MQVGHWTRRHTNNGSHLQMRLKSKHHKIKSCLYMITHKCTSVFDGYFENGVYQENVAIVVTTPDSIIYQTTKYELKHI